MWIRLQAARHRFMALALGIALVAATSAPASAAGRRHHLELGAGYYSLTSDDLDFQIVSSTGEPIGTLDLTTAGLGLLRYRFTLSPLVDLTMEGRGTIRSVGGDISLKTFWVGPGVRISSSSVSVRPYGQASVLLVSEKLGLPSALADSKSSVGFGVLAGAGIRASDLLSIPVEVSYTYGKPDADVSGFGASVGLAFSFGQVP